MGMARCVQKGVRFINLEAKILDGGLFLIFVVYASTKDTIPRQL